MNICKILTVAGADQEEVVKAIENPDFKDFEEFCELMEKGK